MRFILIIFLLTSVIVLKGQHYLIKNKSKCVKELTVFIERTGGKLDTLFCSEKAFLIDTILVTVDKSYFNSTSNSFAFGLNFFQIKDSKHSLLKACGYRILISDSTRNKYAENANDEAEIKKYKKTYNMIASGKVIVKRKNLLYTMEDDGKKIKVSIPLKFKELSNLNETIKEAIIKQINVNDYCFSFG